MTAFIRRRIAQRVYDLCKPTSASSADELAREVKLIETIYSQSEPIVLQLDVNFKNKVDIKPNENFLKSFQGDDCINSVSFNDTKTKLLFTVKPPIIADNVIKNILQNRKFWRTDSICQNEEKQKVVVEYSSPNIAKPFHAGHLRSTVLGNFIAKINETMGHDVVKLNFLGDWGTQFGLLKIGYKLMGSQKELDQDPINHLYKVYVSINDLAQKNPEIVQAAKKYVTKLESGDEKAIKNWERFRDISLKNLHETYERLGINFTEYHGESMYREEAIKQLLGNLKETGILTTIDGAQVVETNFSKAKSHAVLIKKDGSTLYLTRDLAAAIDRFDKYKFDKMYYVVENGQHDHFTALFHILKRMNKPWHSNLRHVKFGRIRHMSTRKGTVVFLKDILDEAKTRVLESMKQSPNTKVTENWSEVADKLATSAVFINDMKIPRMRDYNFDWENILATKGDTGIHLQYTHARLCSLQENCGIQLEDYDTNLLIEPEAIRLIHSLSRFPEVLEDAYKDLEPCLLVNYLFQLSNSANAAFLKLKVKQTEKSTAQARLALFTVTQMVLHEGLKLLGLTPLRKM